MSDTLHYDGDVDPALAEILNATFARDVGVETAARHLWSIHRAGQPAARTARFRMRKAAVTMLSATMLVTSSGGALAASGTALPGDVLYSVKRGAERARLILAVSSEADAKIHLLMARTRMDEAQQALDRARPAVVPRLVNDAIAALEVAERVGGPDLAVATQAVRRETTEHATQLASALEAPTREQLEVSVTRLTTPPEDGIAVIIQPAPRPTDSTEAKAEADSADSADTATATTAPSEEPGTATATPSPTGSPTATPTSEPTTPSSDSSPSPTPTPTATPTPTTTSEPTPAQSGGSRKYESEGTATPSPAPSPTASADTASSAPAASATPEAGDGEASEEPAA